MQPQGFPQAKLWHNDPVDCSLPGSFVHGIFQARVLEWGGIAFSDLTSVNLSLTLGDSVI